MIRFEIDINEADFRQSIREITAIKGGLPRALMRAINRTLDASERRELEVVRDETGLPLKRVKGTFSVRRAQMLDLEGQVVSRGYRVPLIHFQTKPKKVTKKRPPVGVSALVRKYEGFRVFPGTFLGKWPQGQPNVLERTGRKRFPVRIVRGPSVPEVLGDDAAYSAIVPFAQARLVARLQHEIKHLIRSAGTE
jgi:hypothetical protein